MHKYNLYRTTMKVDKVKEKELYSKVVLLQVSNLSLTKQKKESVDLNVNDNLKPGNIIGKR